MTSSDPLLQDILNNIEFRLIGLDAPGSFSDSADLSKVEAYKALDVANTQVWDRGTKIFSLDFLTTPRFSTVAIAYIINRLVKQMPQGCAYLNIGVWCGFSFFAGIIGNEGKRCIGVDNFIDSRDIKQKPFDVKNIFQYQYARFKSNDSDFYEMDYRDYFARHHGPIGVYYYDAIHEYADQMRALELADPYLTVGSYVLIDDTTQGAPREATLVFVQKNPNYQIVLDIKTPNDCHPTFWCGLMVLKKTSGA